MRPKAIDANVILRFVTADHPEMSPRCRALLERVQKGEEVVYLPEAALADVVWTLRSFYKWPVTDISAFVASLIVQESVRMQRKGLVLDALRLFARESLDFSDALIAAETSTVNLNEIYSYDKGFDRLAEIQRCEP